MNISVSKGVFCLQVRQNAFIEVWRQKRTRSMFMLAAGLMLAYVRLHMPVYWV